MAAMDLASIDTTLAPDSDTLIARAVEQARAAVGLPEGTRIVAAMSGGVDSTVTAALLARHFDEDSEERAALMRLANHGMTNWNGLAVGSVRVTDVLFA